MATSDRNLLCFDWLPPDKWIEENLISVEDPRTGKRYCKVCDEHIKPHEAIKHAAKHKKEMQNLRRRQKKEAEKARKIALALAREEKKRLKELEGS